MANNEKPKAIEVTERDIFVKKQGTPGIYLKSFIKNGERIAEPEFLEIARTSEKKYRESAESLDPVLILATIFFVCSCNPQDNFKFTPFDDAIDEKYGKNKIKQIESYIYQLYLFNHSSPFSASGKSLFKNEIIELINAISKVLKNEKDEIIFSSIPLNKCYFSDSFFISILTKDELEKNDWYYCDGFPYTEPYTAVLLSIMF